MQALQGFPELNLKGLYVFSFCNYGDVNPATNTSR